jgi:hypothetical protein
VPPPPLLVVPELPELLEPPDFGGVTGVLGGLLVETGVLTGGVTGVLTGGLTGGAGVLPDEVPPPDELPEEPDEPDELLPVMKSGPAKVLAGGGGASFMFVSYVLASEPVPPVMEAPGSSLGSVVKYPHAGAAP